MNISASYSWVTRIRMVKPVSYISNIISSILILTAHTTKRYLSAIPNMIFAECYPCWKSLIVNGTITFGVVTASLRTIIKVKIMNPKITVVSIYGYIIVHHCHNSQITNLNISRVSEQKSKSFYCGVVSDTFYSKIKVRVGAPSLNLNSFRAWTKAIHIFFIYSSYNTNNNRSCLGTFGKSVYNGLKTRKSYLAALTILNNISGNCFCCIFCNI